MEPVEKFCLSGCGFFGSPATEGHCSVCYKNYIIKKQLSSALKEFQPAPGHSPAATCSNAESTNKPSSSGANCNEQISGVGRTAMEALNPEAGTSEPEKPKKKNRCFMCRKKVGLTGFDCRCGGVFCSLHRYSDMHECKFDYKEMAAKEIRSKNPVVVGAKIQQI